MKTLILGLGNPILTDDAAGLRVAAELKHRISRLDITVMETESGGINLLDLLAGFDRAIIIDAIMTGKDEAGKIFQLTPELLRKARHLNSTHGIDFTSLIDLGRKMDLGLPQEIIIFAIGVEDVETFSEQCSPEVEKAIPLCADEILRLVERFSPFGKREIKRDFPG
jgi:hydrogenase maturation protease